MIREHQDLTGKLAVVTGGSRGIGKAAAKALHEAGAGVVITGRHQKTLEAAAIDVGDSCYPIVCDHSDAGSIQHMAALAIDRYGSPDILVNNAGIMKSSSVAAMSLELWEEVIATNLTGVFLTTQAFLPGMLQKKRGDIIMISSMSGKKGDPGASAYAASKFGLQGFSQSLMHEVRKHNVRVAVLNPSSVDKSDDTGPTYGSGLTLHANDLAATIVHLAALPGRTMIRDMDIYGTNPFNMNST
ncbi:MAG: SDR family NAD(P)-dependent oxidoreductase [Waddliaceae bacterium]